MPLHRARPNVVLQPPRHGLAVGGDVGRTDVARELGVGQLRVVPELRSERGGNDGWDDVGVSRVDGVGVIRDLPRGSRVGACRLIRVVRATSRLRRDGVVGGRGNRVRRVDGVDVGVGLAEASSHVLDDLTTGGESEEAKNQSAKGRHGNSRARTQRVHGWNETANGTMPSQSFSLSSKYPTTKMQLLHRCPEASG